MSCSTTGVSFSGYVFSLGKASQQEGGLTPETHTHMDSWIFYRRSLDMSLAQQKSTVVFSSGNQKESHQFVGSYFETNPFGRLVFFKGTLLWLAFWGSPEKKANMSHRDYPKVDACKQGFGFGGKAVSGPHTKKKTHKTWGTSTLKPRRIHLNH